MEVITEWKNTTMKIQIKSNKYILTSDDAGQTVKMTYNRGNGTDVELINIMDKFSNYVSHCL